MGIREALMKMVPMVQGSWQVAAAYLGMSENALRNRVYEVKGQMLSTEHALALQELSGTSLFTDAVCRRSGHVAVPIPQVEFVENESIQEKFNELYTRVGDMFAEFRKATQNGEIDQDEHDRLVELGDKLHRDNAQLLALMFSIYCKDSRTVKNVRITDGAARAE